MKKAIFTCACDKGKCMIESYEKTEPVCPLSGGDFNQQAWEVNEVEVSSCVIPDCGSKCSLITSSNKAKKYTSCEAIKNLKRIFTKDSLELGYTERDSTEETDIELDNKLSKIFDRGNSKKPLLHTYTEERSEQKIDLNRSLKDLL